MKLSPRMVRIGLALIVAIAILATAIPIVLSQVATKRAVYFNALQLRTANQSAGSTPVSAIPTNVPATQPSAIPNNIPELAAKPTSIPGIKPSIVPTSTSHGQPSTIPTNTPGTQPSAVPTNTPGTQPSPLPTTGPPTPTIPQGGGNSYFSTLPPGSQLPSDQQCAARVRQSSWEPRSDNYQANHTTPTAFTVDMSHYGPVSQQAQNTILPRIDGNFTGTTDEIIQWAACKWGFDENILRAQLVQESDWHQSHVGDNGASFGISQIKRTYVQWTYPNSMNSTAFNIDYMLAVRRMCFEGGILFLGNGYHSGDEWGCVGNWFSGGWMDSGAQGYIGRVQARLQNQDWNLYGAGPAPTPKNSIYPSHQANTGIPTNTYANVQQPALVADIRRI